MGRIVGPEPKEIANTKYIILGYAQKVAFKQTNKQKNKKGKRIPKKNT